MTALWAIITGVVGRNGVLAAVVVGVLVTAVWNAVVYDAGGDAREATIIREQGENNARAREAAARIEREVHERAERERAAHERGDRAGGVRRNATPDPYARGRESPGR